MDLQINRVQHGTKNRMLLTCSFWAKLPLAFLLGLASCSDRPPEALSPAGQKAPEDPLANPQPAETEATKGTVPDEPRLTAEHERQENLYPKESLYGEFLVAKRNGETARLPDYSYAGYHRSEKPLPVVTGETHAYFDVTKYGAIPGDGESDRDAVVAALAAAHQHDGPAVVYFPEGNFRLFEASDFGKAPLDIVRSGIVLKGSGVGSTQLEFAESHLPVRPLIFMRSSSGMDDYWRGDKALKAEVVRQVDAFSVELTNVDELEPGMRVNLNAQMDPESDAVAAYYAPHEVPKGVILRARGKGGKLTDIFELHEVASVEGKVVRFAEPIHLDVPAHSRIGMYRLDNVIEECGIEDMSLRGGFREQYKHHAGSRYGEDYRMIEMNRVFNSWIRRVRMSEFSQAINTWLCGYNTFSSILLEGNAGHHAITAKSSYGNLFACMREQTDAHHGFGVSRSGTNSVFLRCVSYQSLEAHCGYPRSTLFDLCEGGFRPRGGGATFFPMHDKGLAFWNWKVTRPGGRFDFWPEGERYGYFTLPIVAGLHGEPIENPDMDTDLLAYESIGERVRPESLFEAQLARRLGKLPEWLAESSAAFEAVSRHSSVRIVHPADHSVHDSVMVKIALKQGLALDAVKNIELYASNQDRYDGFLKVGEVDRQTGEIFFQPNDSGSWVLKAKLTNTRGEISFSDMVTVFTGKVSRLREVKVVKATLISSKQRRTVYGDFRSKGGAEARRLPNSQVLRKRGKGQPLHELEAAYRRELHTFYNSYGEDTMRSIVEDKANVAAAKIAFDGDLNVVNNEIHPWGDLMLQAEFSNTRNICRMDIHWKDGVPNQPVRLELLTSQEADARYSVVNDDLLWKSSVARLGGTLIHEVPPGQDAVTTLYFPEHRARYARMMLSNFPRGVTEIQFYER